MPETWAQLLDWEDPLQKEMAIHSSVLAWRIPWTEEPGGLQSMGLHRVRHDQACRHACAHTHTNGEKACDSTQDQGWGDFDPRSLSHEQDAGGGGLSDPRLGG